MAYKRNLSSPLSPTFGDDDKKKRKKRRETKKNTRVLRGMSVRRSGSASGSKDRLKTTTKTTVEKAKKEKKSKSPKEKRTILDKRIDRTIKRYKEKGINTSGTRAAMERDSFKSKRETRQSKRGQSKRNRNNNSGRLKSFKEIGVAIKDACKGKKKGTGECASTKKWLK